jgi:hypothetical protein
MITVSSVVVVVSILAIVGIVRKSCCLIFVYQIFVFIFLAMFLAIGVGCIMLPNLVFEGDCRTSKNSLIESANKIYEKSDAYFCKPPCPCAMTPEGFAKYSVDDRKTLNSEYSFNLTTGVINTQSCAEYRNWTSDGPINLPDTIGAIERFLECSDWCPQSTNKNLFYRFWDVNQGKPSQTCYTALHDAFFHYSEVVEFTCFLIGAILLLVCISNICLCCHPGNKKVQFRDRFIYVADNKVPTQKKNNYQRIR